MSSLYDRISRAQFDAALQRLGLTRDEFARLSPTQFSDVLDGYLTQVQAWAQREQDRVARLKDARDLAQGTPGDMSIWAAELEGFTPKGTHQAVMAVMAEVEAESQADPDPSSKDVRALIFAMRDAMREAQT